MTGRRLEIGPGPYPKGGTGWELFDLHPWDDTDPNYKWHVGDARDLSRFADNTFDEIYASQVLEHFSHLETWDVLAEWFRVIKPGGYLTLTLPDVLGILEDYKNNICDWEETAERLYGGQDYDGNTHLAGFTRSEFSDSLHNHHVANFVEIINKPIANGGGFEVVLQKALYVPGQTLPITD